MIVHDYRCVLMHSGKTAGTSVEHMLHPGHRDPMQPDHTCLFGWDPKRFVYLQHLSATGLERCVGRSVLERYYVFSIVRNPYARILSVYYYALSHHQERYGSLVDFIGVLGDLIARPAHQDGSHYLPQVRYTHLEGRPICDDIVAFESLPTSFEPVRTRLGLVDALPRLNTARHPARPAKTVAQELSADTAALIRDYYRDDFSTYGYSEDVERALEPPTRLATATRRREAQVTMQARATRSSS